jgi:hypothetical protein
MDDIELKNELDREFSKNGFIKFFPYIGKKYKETSPKIMVLGESHYIGDKSKTDEQIEEDNRDNYSTRKVFFYEYLDPEAFGENGTHPDPYVRCYRNFAAMISGKGYHDSDYIWDYLSFYNFFQKYIGKGSKGKEYKNDDLIKNSGKAYFEVINILKPDLIIAWGRTLLYYEVPQEDCEYINEKEFFYRYTTIPGTAIWHIPHPSRFFSPPKFHKLLLERL